MKFVLYKYVSGDDAGIQYLTSVEGAQPQFSKHPAQAKRYQFLKALLLALRYGLSWIPEKYTPNK